jgi:rSAM/selenodomain-associated transferase 2
MTPSPAPDASHPDAPAVRRLSIVVPVLNEEAEISATLALIQPLRRRGAEVIVVDGGSEDRTLERIGEQADRVIIAPLGRASQMNAGGRLAAGEVLLFLHADTRLPREADRLVVEAMGGPRIWGRFDVAIAGRHRLLPVIAAMMNRRSRLTGIATGDQAIFVRRDAFLAVGGFPDIPLMEDVALSAKLKRLTPPACIGERVETSGRRWERHGVLRTVLSMWRLRLAYRLGADPRRLARAYGYKVRGE